MASLSGMQLAGRLEVPPAVEALLWDLDGVLVDSLQLDLEVVNPLLQRHRPAAEPLSEGEIRAAFPLTVPEFWKTLLPKARVEGAPDGLIQALTADLEALREKRALQPHRGIVEVLEAASGTKLVQAVVSNNPRSRVEAILKHSDLLGWFDAVVGVGELGLRSKPAPDSYLAAAEALGVAPAKCLAIEDAGIGIEAASAAGCLVAGVATGSASFDEMERNITVATTYLSFAAPQVELTPGDVTDKRFSTPNEFVTHMIEHVAWRLGCGGHIAWFSSDWEALGRAIGRNISRFLDKEGPAETIGMIDDGSAEISVSRAAIGGAKLDAANFAGEEFVRMRCEQLPSGTPLQAMLKGLADGAAVEVQVTVGSLRDPHHTWEAIWRGVGVCLRDLSSELRQAAKAVPVAPSPVASDDGDEPVVGQALSDVAAKAVRRTAETLCEAEIELGKAGLQIETSTSPSVRVEGMNELLEELMRAANVGGRITFRALELSSSHVVAEDLGMAMGIAFRALAVERMHVLGIEGAGASRSHGPGDSSQVRVAISWEGRKAVTFVPIGRSIEDFRRSLIGCTLESGLFSEDLDDFLEGFAEGMRASVIVHWGPDGSPDTDWHAVFRGLGEALAQLLEVNACRRGLIAGVKATLA